MKKTKKIIAVFILAFFNALAVSYIARLTDSTNGYFGVGVYGFNPTSLAVFALDCILLYRFIDKEILKDKARVIISAILGILIGLSSLWGTYMFFVDNSIFDNPFKVWISIPVSLGMALFISPAISELIGFLNKINKDTNNDSKNDGSDLKSKIPSLLYLIIMWVVLFLRFIPIFLYWWPGNFVCDIGDQVRDYLYDNVSTHHPLLHTLLVSKAYLFGYNRGNVEIGIQIFTLCQMLLLSFSFAFFLYYLYKKGVKRIIRVVVLASVLLNPAYSYYAISTIKGVPSAALVLISLTLMFLLNDLKEEKKSKNIIKSVLYSAGIIICMILSCHFRNNMYYACIAAAAVIILLQKGLRKKLLYLLIFALIIVGFKVSFKGLMNYMNADVRDKQRETMAAPLNSLARVAKNHKDDMDKNLYDEICMYIPEEDIDKYCYMIADSVKANASERMLENNKLNFWKLFVKTGLKYPGEYIEATAGLTLGYWYPMECPYFITGTTKLYCVYISPDYQSPENRNLLPFGGFFYDWLYSGTEGRIRLPIFGWAFRGAAYFWGFVFSFMYLCYKKDKRGLTIIMIPLMYMLTCLLGPTSYLRYLIVNIVTFPLLIYLVSAICFPLKGKVETKAE